MVQKILFIKWPTFLSISVECKFHNFPLELSTLFHLEKTCSLFDVLLQHGNLFNTSYVWWFFIFVIASKKKKHLFIGPFQFSSFSAHVFWAPILNFSFRTFHTDLLKENLLMCYCNLAVSLKGHWTNSWHWWKNLFHILSSYKCIVGKWGSSPPPPF